MSFARKSICLHSFLIWPSPSQDIPSYSLFLMDCQFWQRAQAARQSYFQYLGEIDKGSKKLLDSLLCMSPAKAFLRPTRIPIVQVYGGAPLNPIVHQCWQTFPCRCSVYLPVARFKRSFKVRSRVHCKTKVQLSDDKADEKCTGIYKSTEFECMDSKILAKNEITLWRGFYFQLQKVRLGTWIGIWRLPS